MITLEKIDSLEIYDFYDKPVLYSAIDKISGEYYLFYWVGDTDVNSKYYVRKLSKEDLFDYENARVCIRTLLDLDGWYLYVENYDCEDTIEIADRNIKYPKYGFFNINNNTNTPEQKNALNIVFNELNSMNTDQFINELNKY